MQGHTGQDEFVVFFFTYWVGLMQMEFQAPLFDMYLSQDTCDI